MAEARIFKVALIGGETLLGRELEQVVGSRIKSALLTPYAATGESSFAEREEEAAYFDAFDENAVREDAAVLVAGAGEAARKAYEFAKGSGGHPRIIDCAGYLEHEPEARIAAPLLEQDAAEPSWLAVVAHPAAVGLVLALRRLSQAHPVSRAIAHLFEPASEQSKRGVQELHQQTNSLLTFKALDQRVYGTQVAFNLLAQYGRGAAPPLSAIEQRIERHAATLLSKHSIGAPMPSLRLLQAPVFHGYSLSLWVEFVANISASEVGEALASAQIAVRGEAGEAPHNAAAANQDGFLAGDIRVDRNNPRAAWIWIVWDNLRLIADSAADLLAGLQPKPDPQ